MNNANKSLRLENNPPIDELIRSIDGVADDLAWSLKWYLAATATMPIKVKGQPSQPWRNGRKGRIAMR